MSGFPPMVNLTRDWSGARIQSGAGGPHNLGTCDNSRTYVGGLHLMSLLPPLFWTKANMNSRPSFTPCMFT